MGSFATNTIVIRADCDSRIGTGHVMRCLALAQRWIIEGGHAILLGHCESKTIQRQVKAAGLDLHGLLASMSHDADLRQTRAILETTKASWLVLDGYHFDPAYQQALAGADWKVLVFDDCAPWPEYSANIILNQNLSADQYVYSCPPNTLLLLGAKYPVLRPEFWHWRGWRRAYAPRARRILVTLGGGDARNVTLHVIRALLQIDKPELEVKVVLGPENKHRDGITAELRQSPHRLQCLTGIDNMAELMSWADLAVCGGGSTCWEIAFMGLPAIVITLAENQRAIVERLETQKVMKSLGWFEDLRPEKTVAVLRSMLNSHRAREAMGRRAQELVDGEGVERVLMRMQENPIRLRRIRLEDAVLLWNWANDSAVRAVSFSTRRIPWKDHKRWLTQRLKSPSCFFYLGVNQADVPVGQVRFEVSGTEAVISISLDAKFRGRGYGALMIQMASRLFLRSSSAQETHAYIKTGNEASIKAFTRAGFRRVREMIIQDARAAHLVLRRSDVEI